MAAAVPPSPLQILARFAKIWRPPPTTLILSKKTTMTPTREQFKEFMAYVQNAQKKEDKVNDAFELIWDDDQAQHVPFYISPWWKVVRYAFCLLFNLEFNKLGIDDVLEWWLEEAPKGEAK